MPTREFLRLWLPVFLVAALVFTLFPAIDIAASRPFWAGQAGNWPAEMATPAVAIARTAVRYLVWIPVAVVAAGALATLAGARLPPALGPRAFVFLAITYVVGPGLLANTLLKEHWGRARPYDSDVFGGTSPFTPALLPSDAGGASFVSGEVAIAAATCALALLVAGRARVALFALGFALACVIGLVRMAQGGHYLSDVVFAMLFTWLVAWLAHSVVFRWVPAARAPRADRA